MGEIANPDGGDSIEVEIIDSETHGDEYVQVQAVEDGVELSDQSGNAPWVSAEEVNE